MNEREVIEILSTAQTAGIDQATAALNRQVAAVDSLSSASQRASSAATTVFRNAQGRFISQSQFNALNSGIQSVEKTASSAAKNVAKDVEAAAVTSSARWKSVIGDIGNAINVARAATFQGFQQPGQILSGIAAGALDIKTVFAGIGAVAAASIATASIAAAASFEKYSIQFKVLLGSVDAAQARIRELADFAKTTPFELPEVVEASRVLEVFTKGALSTGEGLRLIGDAAAGTGQSFADVAFWTGRLYDAMKNGGPILDVVTALSRMGIISTEAREKYQSLSDQVQAGRITFAQAWAQVQKDFGRFGGQMQALMDSLGGKLSNLSDVFQQVFRDIGLALLPFAKAAVDGLIAVVDAVDQVVLAFGAFHDAAVKAFQGIGVGPEVSNVIVAAFEGIAALAGIGLAAGIGKALVGPLALAAYDAAGAAAGVAFSAGMRVVTGASGFVLSVLGAFFTGAIEASGLAGGAAGGAYGRAFALAAAARQWLVSLATAIGEATMTASIAAGSAAGAAFGSAFIAAVALAPLVVPVVVSAQFGDQFFGNQGQREGQDFANTIGSATLAQLLTYKAAIQKGINDLLMVPAGPLLIPQINTLKTQLGQVQAVIDAMLAQEAAAAAAAAQAQKDAAADAQDAALIRIRAARVWGDAAEDAAQAEIRAARLAQAAQDTLKRSTADYITAVGNADKAISALEGKLKNAATPLARAANAIGTLFGKELADGLRSGDPEVRAAAQDAMNAAEQVLQNAIRIAAPWGNEFINNLIRGTESQKERLRLEYQALAGLAPKELAKANTDMKIAGLEAQLAYAAGLRDTHGAIEQAVKDMQTALKTGLSKTKTIAYDEGVLGSKALTRALNNGNPEAHAWALGVVGLVAKDLEAMGVDLSTIGGQAGKNLRDALKTQQTGIDAAASDIASSASGKVGAFVEKAGAAGVAAGAAFAAGIMAGATTVNGAADRTANRGKLQFDQLQGQAQTAGQRAGAAFASGIQSRTPQVTTAADRVATRGKTQFDELQGQARTSGQRAGSSFASGIQSRTPAAGTAGRQLASAVRGPVIVLQGQTYRYGYNTADAYADGFVARMTQLQAQLRYRVSRLRDILIAGSPPGPESPLHLIDVWGAHTGEAYMDALVGALKPARVASALGGVARAMQAGQPRPAFAMAGARETVLRRPVATSLPEMLGARTRPMAIVGVTADRRDEIHFARNKDAGGVVFHPGSIVVHPPAGATRPKDYGQAVMDEVAKGLQEQRARQLGQVRARV